MNIKAIRAVGLYRQMIYEASITSTDKILKEVKKNWN